MSFPAWMYGDPAEHVKFESEKPKKKETEPDYMKRIKKARRIKHLVKLAKQGRG